MTYHFGGMDDPLREAFRHFTDHIVAVFDAHLAVPADSDQARVAVADLVHALSEEGGRDLALTQELYTLAARQPACRELTHEWMRRSRVHLEKHFDPDTARRLDALIEGLTLHRALATEPHGRRPVAAAGLHAARHRRTAERRTDHTAHRRMRPMRYVPTAGPGGQPRSSNMASSACSSVSGAGCSRWGICSAHTVLPCGM